MNDNGLGVTYDEIMAEIGNELRLSNRMPGDITISEVMERFGVSDETARQVLNKKVSKGQLVKLKVVGTRETIFRPKANMP